MFNGPDAIAPTVLVAGLPSDIHTWNLIYLELRQREKGFRVVNLGSCVSAAELAAAIRSSNPDVVMLSSINGHGSVDALALIQNIRAQPGCFDVPIVIGGLLTIDGAMSSAAVRSLRAAGFNAVFTGSRALEEFDAYAGDLIPSMPCSELRPALAGATVESSAA